MQWSKSKLKTLGRKGKIFLFRRCVLDLDLQQLEMTMLLKDTLAKLISCGCGKCEKLAPDRSEWLASLDHETELLSEIVTMRCVASSETFQSAAIKQLEESVKTLRVSRKDERLSCGTADSTHRVAVINSNFARALFESHLNTLSRLASRIDPFFGPTGGASRSCVPSRGRG